MATVTLDPRQFLQPKRVEGLVNKQLETDLQFANMFNVVPTTETSVTWNEDLVTAGEDYDAGTTGKPLDLGELSELTEVEISPVTQKAGMLRPFGFKIAVSERDLRRGTVVDDLARAVFRGTYIMARKIDDDIIAQIIANSNEVSEVSGAAVWSSDSATPVDDIISFQEAFDLDGYKTQLTDMFVHKTNYYEAKRYFVDLQLSMAREQDRGDQDVIPNVMGTNIHRARSASIAEGSYIGLDSRPGFQPITIHAYRDPQFGASAEFPLVNVYQFKEQAYPHRTITEFVADMFPALKIPNAACYKASASI